MIRIDYESWGRREIFEFFSGMSDPFYSVSFNVDVTKLYSFAKAKDISFYYALVYLVTKAVNSVEALRCGFSDGELCLFSERSPSFTDLKKGSDTFHIVTMPCEGDIIDFCRKARAKSQAQDRFIVSEAESPALIYISCLPWVELTSLTNERDFDPDDAVPRICWGGYYEREGRKILGMSLELNHRFADGVHVGKFAEKLAELIDGLNE